MKNRIIALLLALMLLLTGCAQQVIPVDTRIKISLLTGEGFTVEENGQWVEPGDDAVFTLTMTRGCSLASVDYDGEYDHVVEDGKIILTLKNVRYPERVKVYTIGDVSKEICGGPHAGNTAELKSFKIQKEESSSRGVRRIKAVIGA